VHELISGEGDEECAEGDDQDTGESGDVAVDGVEELRADDGVGSGPTDTCDDVEDGDWKEPGQLYRFMHACISSDLLNFTAHHPNQNRDSTIWRRPNAGPKHEKKHTVITPRRLKKRHTRIASRKPMSKADFPRTPMAKELTTMFAANH
jgi:hypothetical protein